ncbi:hypothetical protein TrVE_jg2452 [Triparma verrucosa]|uniref:Transmembrane protein n=1 Tax=Triparma verrucosa TaxID=1606542 RepID=A0A9W7C5W2_9STRA|nr:hypothetical protein TrVE_jg2452 [Triparma verrucosa]
MALIFFLIFSEETYLVLKHARPDIFTLCFWAAFLIFLHAIVGILEENIKISCCCLSCFIALLNFRVWFIVESTCFVSIDLTDNGELPNFLFEDLDVKTELKHHGWSFTKKLATQKAKRLKKRRKRTKRRQPSQPVNNADSDEVFAFSSISVQSSSPAKTAVKTLGALLLGAVLFLFGVVVFGAFYLVRPIVQVRHFWRRRISRLIPHKMIR